MMAATRRCTRGVKRNEEELVKEEYSTKTERLRGGRSNCGNLYTKMPLFAINLEGKDTHDCTVAKSVVIVFIMTAIAIATHRRAINNNKKTTTTFLDILLIEVLDFVLNDGHFMP